MGILQNLYNETYKFNRTMLEKWEALYRELPGEISFYEEKIGTDDLVRTALDDLASFGLLLQRANAMKEICPKLADKVEAAYRDLFAIKLVLESYVQEK